MIKTNKKLFSIILSGFLISSLMFLNYDVQNTNIEIHEVLSESFSTSSTSKILNHEIIINESLSLKTNDEKSNDETISSDTLVKKSKNINLVLSENFKISDHKQIADSILLVKQNSELKTVMERISNNARSKIDDLFTTSESTISKVLFDDDQILLNQQFSLQNIFSEIFNENHLQLAAIDNIFNFEQQNNIFTASIE